MNAAAFLRSDNEAEAVENAVNEVLTKGYRTADIFLPRIIKIGCREMGERIVKALIYFM
jgi:3-isopropylmalate dehydrogenase